MNKRPIKFRFWCEAGKAFVKDYKYNGLVDELFHEDKLLTPFQFTGMYDCEGKELYEGDIIEIQHSLKKGKVSFKFGAFCVEYFESSTMNFSFLHSIPEFRIVGNVFES